MTGSDTGPLPLGCRRQVPDTLPPLNPAPQPPTLDPQVHAGNTPVARKPTLFFLAHCSADLTDSLLSSNRAAGTLHNLVLLGNSLSAIAAAWQHRGPAAGHAAISTILDLVQPGSCMREVALPEYAFPVISAFNDISIHTFWAAPPLKQSD
ncbi:hypothetical protein ACKKBF_B11265 [Auxenochlorella protothecoides x Auxenochlorella symbiontica]